MPEMSGYHIATSEHCIWETTRTYIQTKTRSMSNKLQGTKTGWTHESKIHYNAMAKDAEGAAYFMTRRHSSVTMRAFFTI
jgi:hypothetical protein